MVGRLSKTPLSITVRAAVGPEAGAQIFAIQGYPLLRTIFARFFVTADSNACTFVEIEFSQDRVCRWRLSTINHKGEWFDRNMIFDRASAKYCPKVAHLDAK